MSSILSIPLPVLSGQLVIGLINGSFYALLGVGLAIIFGMLRIVHFAQGAFFMMGAFAAWMLLGYLNVNYWLALLLAPLIVAVIGMGLERTLIRRLYGLDHMYSLLITFALAMIIESLFRNFFGSAGIPYAIPPSLRGGQNLGFMFLPYYRLWVIVAAVACCAATWMIIEKTSLGALLRAATEDAKLVQSFGVNVPRMIMLTYAAGVALAAFAGVLAAPMYSVYASMGSNIIINVFAIVVIGGMGSLLGAIAGGFVLGVAEALTKLLYPQASATVIFVVMIVVLLYRSKSPSSQAS